MEKGPYSVKVFLARNYNDWVGEIFDSMLPHLPEWRSEIGTAIILRLGKVLSGIKLPIPIEVVLGGGRFALRVALTAVGNLSFLDEEKIMVCLFEDAHNRFYGASDVQVKLEFLGCLKNACRENGDLFSKKAGEMLSQAERKKRRATILNQLEMKIP